MKRLNDSEGLTTQITKVGAGSWLGDLDQVWIRPVGACPSRSGHIFATMHAKWNTHRGLAGDARHWKLHFVRVPDERIHFSNSPMAFPCVSPVLDSSLVKFRSLLAVKQDLSRIDYTAIVKLVLGCIHDRGLALDVVDPLIFHPIPHFVPACHVFGKASASSASASSPLASSVQGVEMPSTDTVLKESSTVSQTWLSWSKSDALYDRPVIRGSLYSQLIALLGLPSLDGAPLRSLTSQFFGNLDRSTQPECRIRPSGKRFRLHGKTTRRMKLLCLIFKRIYPGALSWDDYVPAVAICRSAAPDCHLARARMVFKIERLLRLRGRYVRERIGLQRALSIWACALAVWRAFPHLRVSTQSSPAITMECLWIAYLQWPLPCLPTSPPTCTCEQISEAGTMRSCLIACAQQWFRHCERFRPLVEACTKNTTSVHTLPISPHPIPSLTHPPSIHQIEDWRCWRLSMRRVWFRPSV